MIRAFLSFWGVLRAYYLFNDVHRCLHIQGMKSRKGGGMEGLNVSPSSKQLATHLVKCVSCTLFRAYITRRLLFVYVHVHQGMKLILIQDKARTHCYDNNDKNNNVEIFM